MSNECQGTPGIIAVVDPIPSDEQRITASTSTEEDEEDCGIYDVEPSPFRISPVLELGYESTEAEDVEGEQYAFRDVNKGEATGVVKVVIV